MNKMNNINYVKVFDAVDQFFDDCFSNAVTITTTDSTGDTLYVDYPTYTPAYPMFPSYPNYTPPLFDTTYWINYEFPKVEVNTYPVSNYFVKENGTSVIEIAVTKFLKDEIFVKREGDKLIVKGEMTKIEDNNIKYVWKKIGERDFNITYRCSNRMNLDNLEVLMKDGLLIISIPMKESEKPIIKEIKIK